MSVVIIPAYKPDERLIGIVDQLWTYGFRIVVVDDGSGEDYLDIFNRISDVCILLRHEENRGKGAAIKTALEILMRFRSTPFIRTEKILPLISGRCGIPYGSTKIC